ncbi:hypothetical protein OHT77_15020 [Streptomyces sp. NBC_00252]|uniref:hypothetical protein n=1 Tax=Streptomyces sp. NBC_00252 TaxID=2975691 RepID=UPI002E28FF98|nr:hypothetical protein [Streptomyces sp. NBC_00252]
MLCPRLETGNSSGNELVGLHLATALALVVYFWQDWIRVIRGVSTSITQRRIQTVDRGSPG